MNKATTLIILFFVLFANVFALGITPSRTELDYLPGTVNEIGYTIRGTPGADIETILQGELSQNVEIMTPINFTLDEGGGGHITVKFTMPELTAPGLHEGLVGAQEAIPTGFSGVVARVAVLSQVWVRIPYPDKYLEFSLEAPKQIASDSIMTFKINMINRGQTVEHISGAVEIFDLLGNSIAIVPTSAANNLEFGQSASVSADWSTTGVKAGNYKAIVTINYDDKVKQFEHGFVVGEKILEIISVNASQILKDSIAKVPIIVASKWNENLNNVYATIDISSADKQHITQLQTPTKTVSPWATDKLETYWDTAGLPLGKYTADVTVYYEDKSVSTRKQLRIVETLTEESQFALSSDMLLIGTLVIIIIVLVLFYWKKKKKEDNYR